MMRNTLTTMACAAGLMLAATSANAQTEVLDEKDVKAKAMAATSSTTPDGWKLKVKVGLTGSFNDVNGNAEAAGAGQAGATITVGGVLSAEANFKHGHHGWDTTLNIQQTQTQTPSLDPWIKSLDNLEVISTYFYRLNSPDWLGPFARLRFQTQLFKGSTVEAGRTSVVRTNADGTMVAPEAFAPQSRIPLTGSFEPIQIRESAGVFADPIQEDYLKLNAKLGVGGQHQIVRNGFIVAGTSDGMDATGPLTQVDLTQLQGSSSAGGELDIAMSGVVVKDLLNWKLTLNFFMPFVTNGELADGTKAVGFDGLVSDIQGGISLKLWKYFSLDYALLLRRVPLVVEGWQVVNGLVLSAGFDIL